MLCTGPYNAQQLQQLKQQQQGGDAACVELCSGSCKVGCLPRGNWHVFQSWLQILIEHNSQPKRHHSSLCPPPPSASGCSRQRIGAPSEPCSLAGRQIWWYQPGSTPVRSSPSTAMTFCTAQKLCRERLGKQDVAAGRLSTPPLAPRIQTWPVLRLWLPLRAALPVQRLFARPTRTTVLRRLTVPCVADWTQLQSVC